MVVEYHWNQGRVRTTLPLITSRPIFRSCSWLNNPDSTNSIPGDGRLNPQTASDKISRILKYVVFDKKIGVHTYRKTGALNATLGDANEAELMVAMRISSVTTLATYTRDAGTIRDQMAAKQIRHDHLIDKWRYVCIMHVS
jgi:hypothetical protein